MQDCTEQTVAAAVVGLHDLQAGIELEGLALRSSAVANAGGSSGSIRHLQTVGLSQGWARSERSRGHGSLHIACGVDSAPRVLLGFVSFAVSRSLLEW